jgi:hypothetical protein
MRLPVRSETDAFRAVVVAVAIVFASLLFGNLTGAKLASLILGTILLCIALIARTLLGDQRARSSVREAEAEGDLAPSPRRILLVASETPTTEQLRALRASGPRAILDVHVPVLQSRTHFVTTDIDHETELARRRLRRTLSLADKAGLDASGQVGDPIDPLAGIEDQLRRHHIDEVIVATHSRRDANWVESELLEQLRGQLDKPLTHVETR